MPKPGELYIREFLNTDENGGIAAIKIELGKTDGGEMFISDCGRQINLDFYFGSEEGAKNVLFKITRLKWAIDAAYKHLKSSCRREYGVTPKDLEGEDV